MCQTAIAGSALLLLSASPLWAAPPGSPCNATGALGTTMGGCQAPPAVPQKGAGTLKSDLFSAPIRFTVRGTRANGKTGLRRTIASYVAKILRPHPTQQESALLASTVRFLSESGFPVVDKKIGPDLTSVTVDTKTLNRLARRLARAVASGHLTYRVNRATFTGAGEKENRFVEKSLPIPPGGVMDAQDVSDTLYAVGQVPGFVRADALFSPAARITAPPGAEIVPEFETEVPTRATVPLSVAVRVPALVTEPRRFPPGSGGAEGHDSGGTDHASRSEDQPVGVHELQDPVARDRSVDGGRRGPPDVV
uniref:ORF307 n=1 Tax=Leptospirillum ferrooxidans TaxID=180 RepID=Q58KE9_9BACT|nr:ORF307 [Leptospirillum ferrooxidans]